MGYMVDQEEFESMDEYRVYLKAHMSEATEDKRPALMIGVKRVEKDRPDDFGSFDYVKIRLAETITTKLARLTARSLVALVVETSKGSKLNPKFNLRKLISSFIYNFKYEAYRYMKEREGRI